MYMYLYPDNKNGKHDIRNNKIFITKILYHGCIPIIIIDNKTNAVISAYPKYSLIL